jgi:hypothetical protein
VVGITSRGAFVFCSFLLVADTSISSSETVEPLVEPKGDDGADCNGIRNDIGMNTPVPLVTLQAAIVLDLFALDSTSVTPRYLVSTALLEASVDWTTAFFVRGSYSILGTPVFFRPVMTGLQRQGKCTRCQGQLPLGAFSPAKDKVDRCVQRLCKILVAVMRCRAAECLRGFRL